MWLSYCRDVYGLDEEMLADKPTGWIVQRAIEADETHGNPYR